MRFCNNLPKPPYDANPDSIDRHAQRLLRTHRFRHTGPMHANDITNTLMAVMQDPKGQWIFHPTTIASQ